MLSKLALPIPSKYLVGLGIVYALSTLFIIIPYVPPSLSLRVGEPSPTTILAPRTESFQTASDKRITSQMREMGLQSVKPVYLIDDALTAKIKSDVQTLFDEVQILRRYHVGGGAPRRFMPGLQ